MAEKNIFEDVIIDVNLEYGRKVPLRLQITRRGIGFFAQTKEGEEPSQESLDLIACLDAHLHEELRSIELSKHVHKPDKVLILF